MVMMGRWCVQTRAAGEVEGIAILTMEQILSGN
jgi:hypothetical protein